MHPVVKRLDANPQSYWRPPRMTRRDLLQRIGFTIAAKDLLQATPPQPIRSMPGTQPLTWDGDLAERMMDGAHKYVERFGDDDNPALVAETDAYAVHQVRWPVLDRVSGEGLLLAPMRAPAGYVVAL